MAATVALTLATVGACAKDGEPAASPAPAPVATVTETVTATASPTTAARTASPAATRTSQDPSTSPTAGASPGATAAAGPKVGYVRGIVVKEGGTSLIWDRAAIVDGKVSNPSTTRRLLPLAPDYKVVAGPRLTSSSPDGQLTPEAFEAMFPMSDPPLVRVRLDDAGQVRIIQEYPAS